MSSMQGMAGPEMSGTDEHPLPGGYPDAAAVGWVRTEDTEFAGIHIRMTISPGDRIVEVWETEDGHPVRWLGNVFRIDAEPPGLYLNHRYERLLSRGQRDLLARAGAKFWKS